MNLVEYRKHFTIVIKGNNRKFLFKANDEATADEWVDVITDHIADSQGF